MNMVKQISFINRRINNKVNAFIVAQHAFPIPFDTFFYKLHTIIYFVIPIAILRFYILYFLCFIFV